MRERERETILKDKAETYEGLCFFLIHEDFVYFFFLAFLSFAGGWLFLACF